MGIHHVKREGTRGAVGVSGAAVAAIVAVEASAVAAPLFGGGSEASAGAAAAELEPLETEAVEVADDLIAQREILARNAAAYQQALEGGVGEADLSNVLDIAGGLYNNVLVRQQVLRGVLDNLLDSIVPPL
jgi:hypothetical protein